MKLNCPAIEEDDDLAMIAPLPKPMNLAQRKLLITDEFIKTGEAFIY
jgi:hypothetical protein